jgi:hypothetical protein
MKVRRSRAGDALMDRCEIIRAHGPTKGEPCGQLKEDGTCPFHLDMREDHLRRCGTTLSNGGRCWKYATYTSHHCEKHEREMRQAEGVKDLMRLKRLGRYVVVRDTSVAISDDMQAAIGYLELVRGGIVLRPEANEEVQEVCRKYRLSFRQE